ncbi:MAG: hypothetical protein Q9219_005553 [cf. Caloplaca sp. 3 TL-2023]
MVIRKRILLWDWTNSSGPGNPGVPWAMDQINFNGPWSSVMNWNTWVPPELRGRAQYRPMVHLEAQLSGQDWDNVWNTDQPMVHFFNEPDKNNISPERAAQAWHDQMVPLRQQKGKYLVSPSVASDDNGKNWLADFMNRISDAPPDFIGLHYYGTDGNACIQYLQEMHSKYPQRIIVSEIASIDRNAGSVWNFTVQVANFMDSVDWIFEYGFFGCMRTLADGFVSPDAQLMRSDGNFTDLMQKLNNEQPMVPPS